MELIPNRVVRGELSKIRIRTEIPWSDKVNIKHPEIKSPLVWWAYPYARPWTKPGNPERYVEVLSSVRPDRKGFYTVGSFLISSEMGESLTEAQDLIALNADERNLPYPLELAWRVKPKQVWTGEVFPMILEMRNLASLHLVDHVTLDSDAGGILEELDVLSQVKTREYNQELLYDMPVASWLWILNKEGRYRFPRVKVRILGLNRNIESFYVDVKPVPEAVRESSAVGYFKLEYLWDENQKGDVFSIRVRVEGRGNLNILNLPVPVLSDADLLNVVPDSSYTASVRGYEGWRENRMDFRIKRMGEHRLVLPSWAWLELGSGGRIRRAEAESHTLHSDLSETQVPGNGSSDLLLGPGLVNYAPAGFHWRNWYWIFLLLPGVAFLFLRRRFSVWFSFLMIVIAVSVLFTVVRVYKSAGGEQRTSFPAKSIAVQVMGLAEQAVGMAQEDNWQAAGKAYREIGGLIGEWPGLLHDMALVAMENSDVDLAATYIYRANFLRPGSLKFKRTLQYIEGYFELSEQAFSSVLVPPALIMGIWLLCFNASFVFFAIMKSDFRSTGVIFSFVMSLVFFFFSSSWMIITDKNWHNDNALVSEDAVALKKIPDPMASDWIRLSTGMVLRIVAEHGIYVLVETGYGLEGWLPASSLRFIKERTVGF